MKQLCTHRNIIYYISLYFLGLETVIDALTSNDPKLKSSLFWFDVLTTLLLPLTVEVLLLTGFP